MLKNWTAWSFEDFYRCNSSGKGALNFKDPDPKERIEKIPYKTYNYQDISTSDWIVEKLFGSIRIMKNALPMLIGKRSGYSCPETI